MMIPSLDTQLKAGIGLDRLDESDIPDIARLFADPEVTLYLGMEKFTSIKEAEIWYEQFDELRRHFKSKMYAIRTLRDRTYIGCCGFNEISQSARTATLTYALHKDFWGQGLMQVAMQQLLYLAFNGGLACPINRLQAWVYPENAASIYLLKKFGFVVEGRLRQLHWHHERFWDVECYGLLSSELPSDLQLLR